MTQNTESHVFPGSKFDFEKCITATLKAFMYLGFGVTGLLVLLTIIHGTGRYLFKTPVPGMVELAGFMLVTQVFLMIGYTMVEKRLICVTFIVDKLSRRAQAGFDVICYLICLFVELLALWQATVQGVNLLNTTQTSTVLELPLYPFFFIVAFGWLLIGVATLMHLIIAIQRGVKR